MDEACFRCPFLLNTLLQVEPIKDEIAMFFEDTVVSMRYFDDKGSMWVVMKDGLGDTELWKMSKELGAIEMDI